MDRRYFIGGSDTRIIMGDDDAALLRPQCRSSVIDKSMLALPEARRVRDHEHVRHVTQQPCLICGRRPSDAHHLRFAQSRALSRKVGESLPSHCAGVIIARFIALTMKRLGGKKPVLIRPSLLARCG